jgi:uncharacterized protein YhjY with autotransporter beta-barrel domain
VSSHSRSYRTFRLVLPIGVYAGVCAAVCAPAYAAPPAVAGANPLQQSVFNGVFNMCTQYLDGRTFDNPATTDLHDQCHAIAVSALTQGTGLATQPQALGALQMVSGNQVTTQGALASRVSAGQFANISGRLTALRFGASNAISQGSLASNGSSPSGPQSFYIDREMLDRSASNTSSHPVTSSFAPTSGASFVNTGFLTDDSVRLLSDAGTGGGTSAGAPQVSSPWGVFVQGSYNSGHHDITANEDPFDFHATSITAGLDYNFGPGVVGASIGYDDYDAGFRPSGLTVGGGNSRVEGTSASLYGAWFSDTWTFNGIASYGRLHANLSRQVTYALAFPDATDPDPQPVLKAGDGCTGAGAACSVTVNRQLRGDPSGSSIALGATAGYQISAAGFDLLPQVSFAYRRATIDSFNERDDNDPADGLPLAFNDQVVDSFRSILGVDVSRPVSAPFGVVTPLLHVEWDHEFHTSGPNIQAHYVLDPSLATGVCASCFTLPTDAAPSNYGVAGLGVSTTLAHRIQAFVYDEVLFGYTDYHSNTVSLGLRAQF